jgi:soluble calcium-activated nucleotidase 1
MSGMRKMSSLTTIATTAVSAPRTSPPDLDGSGLNGSTSKRLPVRQESRAYPPALTPGTIWSKVQFHVRTHRSQVVTGLLAGLILLVLLQVTSPSSPQSSSSWLRGNGAKNNPTWGGAVRAGYFQPVRSATEFSFGVITDLDVLSRVASEKKPTFRSVLLPGTLRKSGSSNDNVRYTVVLHEDQTRTLLTQHNEAGRGAEFSELVLYQNRLLTMDDRTGDVFEILNKPASPTVKESLAVPRFVITEGNGETDKGMKWEWSTVKDGLLYLGSMGKEYTREDGSIVNRNNLWIATLDSQGVLTRHDWSRQYGLVRSALNAQSPGYIIIEALNWSPALQKWVVLPRRISSDKYNDVVDEQKGGRQLVLVNEDWTATQVVDIQFPAGSALADPYKGFSTFAFVPNSGDQHALAVRSVEENCAVDDPQHPCEQRSYLVVFHVLTGAILSEEVKVKENLKYEGIEFVDLFTTPPP